MAGKVFIAILAVFLLLGAFTSPILAGIKTWRTVDTTENFIVSTGAAVTTANVTLGSDLFQDDESNVIEVSSSITESPVATSYTAATNVLLISALTANESRTLTINYYAESDNEVMQAAGPFLPVLVIGGLLAIIFIGTFVMKKGR